jgi:hypothetical protein
MRSAGLQTWLIGGAVLAALAGATWVYMIDPTGSTWYPRCPLYWLTGLHCPGCGGLRAAHALAHGRIADALAFNPLLVCGIPLAAAVWGFHRWRPQQFAPSPAWAWCCMALLLAFGVARNIAVYPLNLLAPHVRIASFDDQRASALPSEHHPK